VPSQRDLRKYETETPMSEAAAFSLFNSGKESHAITGGDTVIRRPIVMPTPPFQGGYGKTRANQGRIKRAMEIESYLVLDKGLGMV
jgi:hypothetical protein